jgi:hypothetical protein
MYEYVLVPSTRNSLQVLRYNTCTSTSTCSSIACLYVGAPPRPPWPHHGGEAGRWREKNLLSPRTSTVCLSASLSFRENTNGRHHHHNNNIIIYLWRRKKLLLQYCSSYFRGREHWNGMREQSQTAEAKGQEQCDRRCEGYVVSRTATLPLSRRATPSFSRTIKTIRPR